jgi:hypothetical protein
MIKKVGKSGVFRKGLVLALHKYLSSLLNPNVVAEASHVFPDGTRNGVDTDRSVA